MKFENNLYTSIIQELTDYFISNGFKVGGKTKFYKKSNFGYWDVIVNTDSKKDSVFILSYKIGYRINEIEKIYKQIFYIKSNNKQTALFDLGMLMGLHTSYEQYVTMDVNHYDIIIDFDYHYKRFLNDLFDFYDNSIDIISSTFHNGILSEICNYSSLKKQLF